MGMHFYMARIDHQPFKVRLINQDFQEFLPGPFSAPADKPLVYRTPFPIVGWKIAPRRSGAQHPKDCVDESAIILGYSTPLATLTREVRRDEFPCCVTDVVPMVGCIHIFSLQLLQLQLLYLKLRTLKKYNFLSKIKTKMCRPNMC